MLSKQFKTVLAAMCCPSANPGAPVNLTKAEKLLSTYDSINSISNLLYPVLAEALVTWAGKGLPGSHWGKTRVYKT